MENRETDADKEISWDELAQHIQENDIWFVFERDVYNGS